MGGILGTGFREDGFNHFLLSKIGVSGDLEWYKEHFCILR